MTDCFVRQCKTKKGEKRSIFTAPKEPTLFSKWLDVIPRRNDKNLDHRSKVCEKHFNAGDIIRFSEHYVDGVLTRIPKRPTLRAGAIPALFPTLHHGILHDLILLSSHYHK